MNSSTLKDIFNVMSSNFMLLVNSIVTGFIVPMVLGTTNYGYYRTFTLYMTYTVLLTFGFVDGIILCHGGSKLKDLNKFSFRSSSQFFIIFQFLLFIAIFIGSFFILSKLNRIIIMLVGLNSFLVNVTVYYQDIAQSIMRFSELSIRKTCQALIIICLTIALWLLYELHIIYDVNCIVYILVIIFADLVLFIWYLITYRSLTFGEKYSLKNNIKTIIKYFHTGIYLTFSTQISALVLIIDNQFVSLFFGKSEYGKYSFANSMSNAVLTLLGAISVVLLPHMKRLSEFKVIKIYPKMLSYMLLIVCGALLGYFPLYKIINLLLPKYIQSLQYFRFFLPGIGVACCVTMIICNYYNVLKKSKFYFFISLVILVSAIIIDASVYNISHNSILLSCASLVELVLWYIISECFLVRWFKVKWLKNLFYMLLMIISFVLISDFNSLLMGFILYLVIYLISSLVILKKVVIAIIRRLYNIIISNL